MQTPQVPPTTASPLDITEPALDALQRHGVRLAAAGANTSSPLEGEEHGLETEGSASPRSPAQTCVGEPTALSEPTKLSGESSRTERHTVTSIPKDTGACGSEERGVAEAEALASTASLSAEEAAQAQRAARRAEIEAKVAAARLQQAASAVGSTSASRAVKASDLFSSAAADKVDMPKHDVGGPIKATRKQADFGERKFIKP